MEVAQFEEACVRPDERIDRENDAAQGGEEDSYARIVGWLVCVWREAT